MSTVRFDGIYQSDLQDGYWVYLRFYVNGTVLTTSSPDRPALLILWFREDSIGTFELSHGRYEIRGNFVTFSCTSESGTVDYEGTVDGELLNLSWYSHINDHRGSNTYHFVELEQKTTMVEAFDEESAISTARKQAKKQFGDAAIVEGVKLKVPGSKGLLGFGARLGQYEAEILMQPGVEPSHGTKRDADTSLERYMHEIDKINAAFKDKSSVEYQRVVRAVNQEWDTSTKEGRDFAYEAGEVCATIERHPATSGILSILDSTLSTEQKQSELESLFKGLSFGSYREIIYCNCGYPIRVIYRDGSSGPIMEILDWRQARDDDQYTHEYLCPGCGKHVQTITQ